jgi:hypothetical protein
MAYKEGVAEILIRVSKLKTKKEKIETLRKDHNVVLENIVDLCFNPELKFALPPGEPPYRPASKAEDFQTTLYANMRKFGVFLENGPYPTMTMLNREVQFVNFLESLDPDDAKLVIAIKDKKMPYKGITRKLFEEAWPALASTWTTKEKANG